MNDLKLTREQINNMQILRTNGFHSESILYKYDDNSLLKIYLNSHKLKLKENEIDRLIKIPMIDHIILPKQKVYIDDNFKGLLMPYVKNSKNLRLLLNDNTIDIKTRIEMGNQLSNALKVFHSHNLVYGDIHFDNMIATNTAAYLIDSDASLLMSLSNRLEPLYYLKEDRYSIPIKKETANTDNIKLTLCILSFIYGVDIEWYMLDKKPRECRLDLVSKFVYNMHLPSDLKINLLNMFSNPHNSSEYFYNYSDELQRNKYINAINNDSKKLKQLIKK